MPPFARVVVWYMNQIIPSREYSDFVIWGVPEKSSPWPEVMLIYYLKLSFNNLNME